MFHSPTCLFPILEEQIYPVSNAYSRRSRSLSHPTISSLFQEAWLFLLGVKDADRSKEISTQKRLQHEYEQMDKEPGEQARRVRGDISRCLRRCAQMRSSRNIPRLLEEIVSAYCNHNRQVEYYPAMVNIAVPIVFAVKKDWNAYACFERVVNLLGKSKKK